METKKILAILLAVMLTVGTLGTTTFADDNGDDDRGERYDDDRYKKDKYINPSDLPQKVKDYISQNYTSGIRKAEYDDNEIEVKLQNGTEVKFYTNGDFKYAERDDDRYNDDNYRNTNNNINQSDNLAKIQERNELKAKYKASFKTKLGNRLDSIPQTKLETIIILIDTKVLELETDTTKTAEQKEKLVIIYSAIRDLISEKIAEINEGAILDDLLK